MGLEMFKYGECPLILETAWIANSVFDNEGQPDSRKSKYQFKSNLDF
jgi:hypothetical protein